MSTTDFTELRPVANRSAGADWATAGLGTAIAIFFVLRAERGQVLLACICLALVVATLALRQLSRKRTVVQVRGTTVTFVGLARMRTLSTAHAPARVTHVTIDGSGRAAQIWASSNDSLMFMTASWDADALAAIATQLKLEVGHVGEAMTMPEIADRFPGVVPWYGAHPQLATGVALVVLLALVLPFTV